MLAGQALYRDLQRQWSFAAAPAAVADSAFVSFCLSAEAPLKTPPWKVKSEVLFLRKQRAEVWPERSPEWGFSWLVGLQGWEGKHAQQRAPPCQCLQCCASQAGGCSKPLKWDNSILSPHLPRPPSFSSLISSQPLFFSLVFHPASVFLSVHL